MTDEQDGLDPAEQRATVRERYAALATGNPCRCDDAGTGPLTSARGPTVAALADTAVAGGRAYGIARCLRKCRRVTVRPGGRTESPSHGAPRR